MGSGLSTTSRKWDRKSRDRKEIPNTESSRILFLLYLIHRTWNVVVEHVDTKSSRWRGSEAATSSARIGRRVGASSIGDTESCADCCCSYCRLRETAHDCISELSPLEDMASCAGVAWSEEPVPKEKQRPPVYNPEDYAAALSKWIRRGAALYCPDSDKARSLPAQPNKDYSGWGGAGVGGEMSLRQFGSAGELLAKLRADLRLSFPSFVQEFACEPLDGVTLLLELLRGVQRSADAAPPGSAQHSMTQRRRPLLDELACLQCLWSCVSRHPDSARRLLSAATTLAAAIMSATNKSRVLALQLLTAACRVGEDGHSAVCEALSALRLRYGEPVRFRFLVGMLAGGAGGAIRGAGLAFLNALLTTAPTPRRRLYLQAELDQAGFDIIALKKMISKQPERDDRVLKEIETYERQLIDVDSLSERATEAQREKDDLRRKLDLLEKRVKILQEEKGILMSLEKCLKEKCCELQEEVCSLRSEHGNSNRKKSFPSKKKNSGHRNKDESSPPEDEGISSSERSLSPEGDHQRSSTVYEIYNVKNETIDLIRNKRTSHKKPEQNKHLKDKKPSDDEDETTIDDVIQELRNIVNDAESEQYNKDSSYADDKSSQCNQTSEINVSVKALEYHKHINVEKEDSITSTRHSIQITSSTEFLHENEDDDETEIVPSRILPHPPRRAKSLVHLYSPPVEHEIYNKAPDLYDDTYFSSDEGSDSLLSTSRCQNLVLNRNSISSFDFNERRAVFGYEVDRHSKDDIKIKCSRTKSREGCRKTSIKRSESFQTSEKSFRHREYIDSMFHNDAHSSLLSTTPPRKSSSKGSKVDEIVSLIESKKLTKSLDRIDEGLNSFVDIIMTNEPTKRSSYEKRQRSCSQANSSENGKETPLVPVTQSHSKLYHSRASSNSRDSKGRQDSPQKLYLPHTKISSSSFDSNISFNAAFLKRGNAGFYSGTNILHRDGPMSMTSLVMNGTHSKSDLKRALSPMGSSNSFGTHKVTDMASGLY